MRLQRRRFSEATDVRVFPHGQVEVVELDDVVVGRMTYEPGWRWSVDVKPIAGTDRCQFHHLGVTMEGRLRIEMPDGTELEIGPGDVFEIPPGHDAWVVGDRPWISVDFEAMRAYARSAEERGERTLATILFTDIVDSTAIATRLGDTRWRELVSRHNERAQAAVDRYRGRVVKWTGDGMLALFDGAERAVRAALLLRSRVAELELHVRQGIHSGEVDASAGDVRGIAVHTAARIMALAGPDDVLVSATIRDVLDGTPFVFEERGRHELKGLSGERPIFAVAG
ncbi:MAG: adenylate/guanylate cyclase domain-containing protein [Candidatus Limnocylindria bacterium]